MNDQQIKEKMEKLNTLAGGIVYGKEEAWDKLQARMDRPRKITVLPAKYWAVAAILLLSVGIAFFYPRPVAVVRSTTTPAPVLPQEHTAIAHTDAPAQAVPPALIKKSGALHHRVAVNTKPLHPILPAPSATSQPINAFVAAPANVIPATAAIPAVAAKPMKVIYIADAEQGEKDRQTINGGIATTTPAPDFKRMPVLHINDVVNDEEHIKAILRENRMTSGHGLFFRRNTDIEYTDPNTGQYNESYPLLKKIFNPQN